MVTRSDRLSKTSFKSNSMISIFSLPADVTEYQQYTLDEVYFVSEGWINDIFCFLHDIFNLISFQKSVDAIECESVPVDLEARERFARSVEYKYSLINKYEFTEKYAKYEMEDMVMLYDIMRFRRVNNKITSDIVGTVRLQNPDYAPKDVTTIDDAPNRVECFLAHFFNQAFADVTIDDFYERFFDMDRLMKRQVNALDKFQETGFFIIKSSPHGSYKYAVYRRSSDTKLVFDKFIDALFYLSCNTEYNLVV